MSASIAKTPHHQHTVPAASKTGATPKSQPRIVPLKTEASPPTFPATNASTVKTITEMAEITVIRETVGITETPAPVTVPAPAMAKRPTPTLPSPAADWVAAAQRTWTVAEPRPGSEGQSSGGCAG